MVRTLLCFCHIPVLGITKLYPHFVLKAWRKEKAKTVQTQLASLLLIVSAVALASVVVGFATAITQQTLSLEDNPQVEQIQSLQEKMLNETSTWLDGLNNILQNQTQPAEP